MLIPPLKLLNYISYLWGYSATPDLGMRLIGWEYASSRDLLEPSSFGGVTGSDGVGGGVGVGGGGNVDSTSLANNGNYSGSSAMQQHHNHQRHVNFQYGNRRLMVEEALRTMAVVLPPRGRSVDNVDAGDIAPGNMGGNVGGSSNTVVGGAPGGRFGDRENVSVVASAGRRANNNGVTATNTRNTAPSKKSWMRRRFLSFMGVVEEEEGDNTEEQARYANIVVF